MVWWDFRPGTFATKAFIWGFPKIRGNLFGGPYNKDYSILGSILGSPYFGELPYANPKRRESPDIAIRTFLAPAGER